MKRLGIAFALVAVWALITVFGGLAQAGQGSLGELVSRQVALATPAAALFLLVSARLLGWRDLGLNAPRPAGSVVHFWLIGLYVAGIGTLAVLTKSIPTSVLIIILINTAFVGLSEELAFRGVLWGAARKALPFWAGVLLVSAAFGSVHLLNAFITGQVGEAMLQAFNAFLSGLGYLAVRIRTRSIIPILIAHWLWDLVIFMNAAGPKAAAESGAEMNPLMGAALVAPIALYGLWLIRKRQYQYMTDDPSDDAGPLPASAP